jgi:surface polysaccharide O-acyltransferase-like enzyme
MAPKLRTLRNTGGISMRRQRIDAFRLYAMFMVICAHAQLKGNTLEPGSLPAKAFELSFLIAPRFVIPFFFIVSGYFVGAKMAREPSKAVSVALGYTKRLAQVWLFWCVVYAVEQGLWQYGSAYGVLRPTYWYVSRLVREEPVRFLFEGTRVHLWFLVSLILTVWLYALWPLRKKPNSFLVAGGILYVFGLLAGSYRVTPFGFDIHFDTRNGVFFGTLFFALGIAFRHRMPRVNRMTASGMALIGLAIFCLEAYYLRIRWKISPVDHDYLLGSIPFGVGIALLAFAQQDSRIDRFVGPYGRYTLGIYTIHMIFVDLLQPLGSYVQPIVWQFLFPLLVFGASLLATIVIARTPLRRMVV